MLLGDITTIDAIYIEIKTIQEKIFDKKHTSYTSYLNFLYNLKDFYMNYLLDFTKAEAIYLEIKTTQEKVLGKKHFDNIKTLMDLASFYESPDFRNAPPKTTLYSGEGHGFFQNVFFRFFLFQSILRALFFQNFSSNKHSIDLWRSSTIVRDMV